MATFRCLTDRTTATWRATRIGALVLLTALTAACATGQYQWGGYDAMLYNQYKDPTQAEAMRVGLTEHLKALEQANARIAPGLYAELGTLYLENGDASTAIRYYEMERQTWPQSEGLMSALITNLQRVENGKQGDANGAAAGSSPAAAPAATPTGSTGKESTR